MSSHSPETRRDDEPVERALRESNLTFEAIYDAVIIADSAGRIVNWNPAAQRIYGWSREEVVGRIADFLQPDGSGDEVTGTIIEAIQRGAVFEAELPFVTKGGQRGTTETIVVPVRDETGAIVGSVGVNRDVTRRKAMSAALRAREAELLQSQKMEAVGRLTGGLAHDFNNVLAAVSGYAQMLLDYDLPDEAREDVRTMLTTLRHAGEMTRQLLALSRRQPSESRVVDPDAVLRDVLAMLGRVLGRGIRLKTDPNGAGARVCIDAVQLEQVALNLVVNARDAVERGGEIEVRTERTTCPPPDGGPPFECFRLTVRDDGAGMPEPVAARAFEPFFTTKSQEQGTGLGLATVYAIAVQHGGRVRLTSEEGVGTTVVLELPVTDRPAGEPCQPPQESTES